MSEKPMPSPNQILSNLINYMMDRCESNILTRIAFEQAYVKEDYKLDWNKRLDDNGEWKDKKEIYGDV